MQIEAVDLFCGAGGLSYGLQKSGIKINAGVDFEKYCQFAYETNIIDSKFIHFDISKMPSEIVSEQYQSNSVKLLAGCAPCQPFSSLSNRVGKKAKDSTKWPLLKEFARIINDVTPDLITMENVPGLLKEDIFQEFLNTLNKKGYFYSYQIVNAEEYGLPQRRKRLVLIASKIAPIALLSPQELGIKPKTVKDAIFDLPKLKCGDKTPNDPLHYARLLSKKNLQRIKASKPGGTWKDWPHSLLLECHKKASGQTFTSVYGRMEWDKVSPTITTQATNYGTGRFGHPEQNRAITLREAAILQSFPKDYVFIKEESDFSLQKLGLLIGNAVPVDLGYAIGMTFQKHIQNHGKGSIIND